MATIPNKTPQVNALLDAALSYVRQGLPVFPARRDKTPHIQDWPNAATAEIKQIREWWTRWPDASIGMPTGYRSGRVVLDIDPRHGGDKSLAVMEEQYGPLPETLEVQTGGGGRHLHFQLRGLSIPNSAGELAPGIDVRGVGGFVILPPSPHPSGHRYGWAKGNIVSDLPPWLEKKLLESKPRAAAKETPGKIPVGQRNTWLVSQAGRYRRQGDGPETVYRKLLVDYETRCEHTPPVEDTELRAIAKWTERFAPEPETMRPPKSNIPPAPERPERDTESLIVGSGREDTTNALRFANSYAASVRYWHGRNKWTLWRGRWADDQGREVQELAKATAKNIFLEAANLSDDEAKAMGKWAERSLSRDRINAMLDLAKSDPRIRMTTEQFDRDPFLLNFLNGTVDLRTGELRPHRREDFITKLVAHDYVPGLVAPRWLAFLKQIFGELDHWIQKAMGYSLTGITSEKVTFLLWGKTDTGKTTFLTTLREVFADYAASLQIETLMWTKTQDNNTSADLADLRGARLVVTSETEEGQRLREAKLKRITQGTGRIKTARKYENPIEFPETHKLWADCNHQPLIRGTGDDIWNRIITIPCTHQIAEKDKDPELKNKFLREAEGIAAWTVSGAVRWHTEGLGRPDLILETRAQWREGMDTIGQFISECCVQDAETSVRAGEFYKAFKSYCEEQGHEHVITATAFGLRLAERGLNKRYDNKGTFYSGIKLTGGLF